MASPQLHTQAVAGWPFPVAEQSIGYCTHKVTQLGYPVLMVLHDWNGDWCFYDGTEAPLQPLTPCLATVTDASLAELADLPLGWSAWRVGPGSRWHREREPFDAGLTTLGG